VRALPYLFISPSRWLRPEIGEEWASSIHLGRRSPRLRGRISSTPGRSGSMVAWTERTAATRWYGEHRPSAVRNGVINTEACSRACCSASPQHGWVGQLLYRQARQAWLRASGGRSEYRLPMSSLNSHYTSRYTHASNHRRGPHPSAPRRRHRIPAVTRVVAMCEPPASHASCGCDVVLVLTPDTASLG